MLGRQHGAGQVDSMEWRDQEGTSIESVSSLGKEVGSPQRRCKYQLHCPKHTGYSPPLARSWKENKGSLRLLLRSVRRRHCISSSAGRAAYSGGWGEKASPNWDPGSTPGCTLPSAGCWTWPCVFTSYHFFSEAPRRICPTTFRFQETEMRADVLSSALAFIFLLPLVRGSIFVIALGGCLPQTLRLPQPGCS